MNKRALTLMLMLFSFLLLPISGIPLHLARSHSAPSLLEHFLMSVHNISALLFLIAAIFHLSFNWKALTSYCIKKSNEFITFKKEMIVALLVIIIIVSLFSSHAFHVSSIE